MCFSASLIFLKSNINLYAKSAASFAAPIPSKGSFWSSWSHSFVGSTLILRMTAQYRPVFGRHQHPVASPIFSCFVFWSWKNWLLLDSSDLPLSLSWSLSRFAFGSTHQIYSPSRRRPFPVVSFSIGMPSSWCIAIDCLVSTSFSRPPSCSQASGRFAAR